MGAGQGRNRRTQTSSRGLTAQTVAPDVYQPSITAGAVSFVPRSWTEFVQTIGAGRVKLYQYYLGETTLEYDNGSRAKLLSELLADTIAAGVIFLPGRYEAADFEFKVEDGVAPRLKRYRVSISLKAQPELEGKWSSFPYDLAENQTADHEQVYFMIMKVARGINSLLRANEVVVTNA